MPREQRLVAERAIKLAKRGLDNCIRSVTYREGLKYGMSLLCLSRGVAPNVDPPLISCSFYPCNRYFCGIFFDTSSSLVVSRSRRTTKR
jgi:hypothetical protein